MELSCSPRVFTKLLKPIFALLHQYGFASLIYIDDAFLQGDTYEQCEQNVNKTVWLFYKTGFTIHPEKSVLEPAQKIAFLGFLIDSIKMIVTLTPKKHQNWQNYVL